jgi:type II secretory pathway predicted ATPase ExeA
MYYEYFGLKQAPFKITPDTSLFYPGGNRGEILNALIYAVTSGEGIVKVVGEVGSGKTMLCRMLQQELPASVEIVYLANPSLSPQDILHAIAFELKLPVTPDRPRIQVMKALQEYLVKKHGAGQQVVVFVEEAQSMPLDTLEEIRFLSNLETQQNKLLQIILFGQPELDEKIATRGIRQLRERITYSFQLNPFKIDDVRDYLYTRLRACGYRSGEVFTTSAVRAIGNYSRGLVRRINIIADKAMLAAYATNQNKVTITHVRRAARDSNFGPNLRFAWYLAAVPLLLLAGWGAYHGPVSEAPASGGINAQAMPPPPQIEVAQTVMTPAPPTIEPAELPVAKPAEVEAPAPQTQVIIPQPVESIDATRPVEIATPDDVLSDVNEP